MALPASDNFNRADANPIGGNWTTITSESNIQISGNKVFAAAANAGAYWNADTFNNDQWSQATTFSNTGTWISSVRVRVSASARTYYMWRVATSTTCQVYKRVTGTLTKLGSDYSLTIQATGGDVLKLEVSGSTLTPYWNGAAQTTQSDSAIASGSAGLGSDSTSRGLDDWSGGNIGGSSGPANLKSFDGLAKASIKNIMNLAIASVKSVDGLA